MVSIGGAGTFDGVFLTDLAAALLASQLSGNSWPGATRKAGVRPTGDALAIH